MKSRKPSPGRALIISKQASHDELTKIERACADVDVVVNAATSDDLGLTKSINLGLKKGRSALGKMGVLVHISGTQLIESEPTGELEDVPRYDDLNVEQIKAIPDEALHRLIDLEYVWGPPVCDRSKNVRVELTGLLLHRVVRADLAGDITASIICPGVIFGRGTGPKKTISSPLPNLVRLALKHDRVLFAGKGTNIWAHVQIQDVSDMIMLSLKHNLDSGKPAGFERFYLYVYLVCPPSAIRCSFVGYIADPQADFTGSAENGEHEKRKLCTQMAAVLHREGVISDATPLSVPADGPMAPSWANKTTSRCLANRARRDLHWRPKVLLEDVFEAEILDVLSAVRFEP